MDEKMIAEIALMIVDGADPREIPAYNDASPRDRRRIDAKVRELRRQAAMEAERQAQIEEEERERILDDLPQPQP